MNKSMTGAKKIVIFDFDDTLIDTNRVRNNIVELARILGVPKKSALSARGKVRSSSNPFTIENYAQYLFPKNLNQRNLLIKSFNKMFGQKAEFNYSGVEQFLDSLSKKYKLIMLTYGDKRLQQKKITQSGLSKYFSKVIISADNTKMLPIAELVKMHRAEMLFIDNSKAACNAACALGLPMIWVTSKRKDEKYFKQLSIRIKKRLS